MKIEVVLKPCPWCRKTPDIWMPTAEETWCWVVCCNNMDCSMKPRTPHVSFRKSAKKEFFSWHGKIEHLANTWNGGNPFPAFEMKVIDLQELTDLNKSAEYLCNRSPWFKRIDVI